VPGGKGIRIIAQKVGKPQGHKRTEAMVEYANELGNPKPGNKGRKEGQTIQFQRIQAFSSIIPVSAKDKEGENEIKPVFSQENDEGIQGFGETSKTIKLKKKPMVKVHGQGQWRSHSINHREMCDCKT
jgi:hypothetical protein